MFASSVVNKEPTGRKERVRANQVQAEEANRNIKESAADLDSAAHAMGKDMRDIIENAIDSASASFSQAKEKISDTAETVTHRIRENPVTSTAITAAVGLGIGLLVGAFFRRR